jgi:hypothetical protein
VSSRATSKATYERNVSALNAAIDRAVVDQVDPGLKLWIVMLDGEHIGSVKHERTDGYSEMLIWQYQPADRNYWAHAPNRKSAVNSLVHTKLFARADERMI